MDVLITKAAANIAANLRSLRERRGLSQQLLANLAGLKRASIAQFETGTSNPGLESLLKLSRSLQVSIDELISAPRSECVHIKAQDVPVDRRSKTGVKLRKLLPENLPSTAMDELSLAPGASLRGSPHTEGTREYFTCIQGEFKVIVQKDTFIVKAGDVLTFPGNRQHVYQNPGKTFALGVSVVFFTTEV